MNVLGIYNIKGGVGKTASAVNLAYLASLEGLRTLVWDLDAQGASSYYFRIKAKVKGGEKQLIGKKGDAAPHIKGTDYEGLDLLPADFSYRHLDLHLSEASRPAKPLKKLLNGLEDEYDLVILDCPPSLSLLSEAVFECVDALLIPTIPTTLSLRTLAQLVSFTRELPRKNRPGLWPFFSMVDVRKSLHRKVIASHKQKKTRLLGPYIPYASDVEQMGIQRAPLGAYAHKRSRAGQAYRELWQEVQARLREGNV